MKRFHVHIGVTDLDANIRFYSNLFGSQPSVRKADYAKWMVDEPRLNFAISTGDHQGVSHLGLEGDSALPCVADDRSGMSMRLQSGVGGGKLNELCHRVCARGVGAA